jgi:hypothetical protein
VFSPVAQAIGENIQVYYNGVFTKPHVLAYKYHRPTYQHLFVDDSPANLEAPKDLPNWHPVLFSEQNSFEFPTVGSIWEIGLMCHSIDQWASGLKN